MQHAYRMGAAVSSVRVSRETLEELERFRQYTHAKTADEAIHLALKFKRRELLRLAAGSMKGRLTPFTEADRVDSDR
jgi:hypothetical protein